MMFAMPTLLLALAIVSNGLYAGFMLTFRTGVMPALARLTDEQFLAAMRRINEVVPRPLFLLTFVSIVVFPALALVFPAAGRTGLQRGLIVAGLLCAILNHLVTVAGNVPLNNALAASGAPGDRTPDREARAAFEPRWNRFHLVRTLLTVAAFALLVAAALW
ncbi:membrane protein [Streptomyces inusitatus]|uniref:Membrane protein n=2 Tax=Streptomyces inusitatus TaxID=68221 RepID=A0A918PYI6_9ACTN|nr:membrane protein [Streptomyces inusitatus]